MSRLPDNHEPERGLQVTGNEPIYGEARPIATPQIEVRRIEPTPPRLVWVLLAAIVIMYLLSCLLSGSLQPNLLVLVLLGAKENTLIANGQYWRLLSAIFLHGSLLHIFFNSYALFALGPESERIYGTGRFLALYFLAGLGGSLASYLISTVPSVGASGSIFGLIGGLGMFYYLSRQALGEFGRAQTQSMATIAVINLVIGFSSAGRIDNWAHLGGLVVGMLAGVALAPRLSLSLDLHPPVLIRRFPPWGWAAVVGLALLLGVLVVSLPGAR